jgi:putative DNA primase/helicase
LAERSPASLALAPPWLIDFARDRKSVLGALGEPIDGGRAGQVTVPDSEEIGAYADEQAEWCWELPSLVNAATNLRTPETWSEAAEARLRSALPFISAVERDRWLKVGAVLHDLTKDDARWQGRELFDEWSATCPDKFDPDGQEKAWASYGRDYNGEKVTIATIYHWAREAGWSDPSRALAVLANTATPLEPKAGVDFSEFLRTDAGNALLFLALFGDNLRFVEKWNRWLVWVGGRWIEFSDLAMLPVARRATDEMLSWAAFLPTGNADKESWIKHALSSQKEARLRSMIGLAKGEASNRIEPADLDRDPMLLGCPNGVIDLRTGVLRDARREDLITKQISVAFDANGQCANWLAFLDWAFQGDKELIEFLQRYIGYVLTGEVSEELMCVFVGDGANGKSTVLMTLLDLMNDYAGKAQSDLLVHAQGKEGAASPDVAALHGKRLIVVSETDDGCVLSEARIKDIVSNEKIAARRLHQDPFEFWPSHKIILATNHRPRVKGTDNGIWRRLAIVGFNSTIADADKITDYRERVLRPELPGILRWAVEGCLRRAREGMTLPTSVRRATGDYRAEMDTVAQWRADRTEPDATAVTPTAELFSDYKMWGESERIPTLGRRRFCDELDRQGILPEKLSGGTRARRGLRLLRRVVG